jgi:NAD(P)-dependent dehydrogenase (short-subunit alcohol dehydrogenase family)
MSQSAAFVVGGSGGLGSAICRALADEWEAVVVGYRSGVAKAEALASEIGGRTDALALQCDVLDVSSIQRSFEACHEKFGRIGTVIFASGYAIAQPFVGEIGESSWREVLETELIGFTRIVAAALPLFRAQKGGNFVAVTTMATRAYPPGDALSAVPKAGVEVLCRAIAKEEGRNNIRANSVAPGIIDSGLGAEFLKSLYTPEIWEAQRRRIALRRFGSGDEIAEGVRFLASERARYITGQTLMVDGGFSL